MPVGYHLLDLGGALPVLQLADVEVARLAVEPGVHVQPAEEDVAGRLHQALTGDDALARGSRTRSGRGTPRAPTPRPPSSAGTAGPAPSRPSSSAIHARVPTLPTPTTLRAKSASSNCSSSTRRSNCERLAVAAHAADAVPRRSPRARRRRRADRSARSAATGRRSSTSPSTTVVSFENAAMLSLVRAFAMRLLRPLDRLGANCDGESREHALDLQVRVPHREVVHRRECRHRVAVLRDRVEHDPLSCSLARKPLSRAAISMLTASRLTSHSHGPGSVSSKSLMSNTSAPLGRGEHAEVRQVRVAAALHRQAPSAAWPRDRGP